MCVEIFIQIHWDLTLICRHFIKKYLTASFYLSWISLGFQYLSSFLSQGKVKENGKSWKERNISWCVKVLDLLPGFQCKRKVCWKLRSFVECVDKSKGNVWKERRERKIARYSKRNDGKNAEAGSSSILTY